MVKQTIKTVGITDVLTVEYTWEPDKVSWELVKASQLKSQKCSYTLAPAGQATKVRFDITVELAIPLPGFILKKVMKAPSTSPPTGCARKCCEAEGRISHFAYCLEGSD